MAQSVPLQFYKKQKRRNRPTIQVNGITYQWVTNIGFGIGKDEVIQVGQDVIRYLHVTDELTEKRIVYPNSILGNAFARHRAHRNPNLKGIWQEKTTAPIKKSEFERQSPNHDWQPV